MHDLVLVSQSPRRKDLLLNAGFVFRTDTVKVSEFIEENLKWGPAIEAVAKTKASAWVTKHNSLKSQKILVLSADTVVIYNDQVLGKPNNPLQAEEFLSLLSGKTHSVISGICLWDLENDHCVLAHDRTEVDFLELSQEKISEYVAGGEPLDKAGAYAIQGQGAEFVKDTRGSWSNVVGLPMELLEQTLTEQGWQIARK